MTWKWTLIFFFFSLIYDNKTRTTRSPDGVDIKTVGFGDTASVEWLDPNWLSHEISSGMCAIKIFSILVIPFDFIYNQ